MAHNMFLHILYNNEIDRRKIVVLCHSPDANSRNHRTVISASYSSLLKAGYPELVHAQHSTNDSHIVLVVPISIQLHSRIQYDYRPHVVSELL